VSFQLLQATSSEQGSSPSRDSSRTPASRVALDSEQQAEEQDARVSPGSEKSRPKRAIRPPQPVTSQRGRQPAPTSASIAPNLSEKELKSTTHHNTMRNQVYLCAIDRQIVRKTGPRPPSPTSKIRTTADRDEAEKNAGREARAKRRSRGSDGDTESDSEDDVHSSVVERLTHVRGPGDEDDYTTPARPAKKAKTAHEHEGPAKSVKWDKGLVVIRPHDGPLEGSRPVSRSSTIEDKGSKGCLRDDAKVRSYSTDRR